MFVYNYDYNILTRLKYKKKIEKKRRKKVCEESPKERRVYCIILGGLVRYRWTRWQHCTACFFSLSLSLTRGIRDSNIFSNNDPEFFVRKLYRNTRFKKCFAIISCHRTHRITYVLSSESQNILNALLVPTCTL